MPVRLTSNWVDPCGGREVTRVPTATARLASALGHFETKTPRRVTLPSSSLGPPLADEKPRHGPPAFLARILDLRARARRRKRQPLVANSERHALRRVRRWLSIIMETAGRL